MPEHVLHDLAAFHRALQQHPRVLLFKHSPACAIAEHCGVKHESPQAILFEEGRAAWHASHDAITAGALHAAWAPRC